MRRYLTARWIPVTADHLTAIAGGELHAVEHDFGVMMRTKRRTFATVCGRKRAWLVGQGVVASEGEDPAGIMLTWPPYARTEFDGETLPRCRECWVATGRARPAWSWHEDKPREFTTVGAGL